MTPRLASPIGATRDSLVGVAHERGRWRWFAVACFVVGSAIGLTLVLLGAPFPAAGPLVLLAIVLALAVNRFAFFPTELAVTAEASVLLCAVVAFRADSVYAGAWLLAFCAGPLDVLHWRNRSFVRMAYNAGNRMLATLAAAFAFDAVVRTDGGAFLTIAAGGAVASIVFALVEGAIGTVLVRVRTHDRWRDATRIELPMELLTVPLGLLGAIAGYVATDFGWWWAIAILVPAVFVPELALVHGRRPAAWRRAAPVLVGSAVIAVLAIAAPLPPATAVVGLVVVAVVVGADSHAETAAVPVAAAAVVGAALVAGGNAAPGAAVLGATVATAVAGVLAPRTRWWAPVLAATAALAVALAYDWRPSAVLAAAAAVAFVVLAGAGVRAAVWSAPLSVVAVSASDGWRGVGVAGGVLVAAGLGVTIATATVFGAAPWRSRVVATMIPRHLGARDWSRVVVLGVVGLSAVCALLAATIASTRLVLVPVSCAACASVATIALVAVRQWRFAPRARARDVVLVAVAVVMTLVVDARAHRHVDGWTFAALAVALLLSLVVVWPLTTLVGRSRPRASQRMPESRSASR